MNMKPTQEQILRTLIKARKLISKPGTWTQRTMSRDKSGYPVGSKLAIAARWCAAGAISNVSPNIDAYRDAVKYLSAIIPHASLTTFNDARNRTHKQVLALFDKGIKALKGEV